MITKEEAWNLIRDANEEAHAATYDAWVEADDMEDEDPDMAEEMREDASEAQAYEFRNFLTEHDGLLEACQKYAEEDEDFKAEWDSWYQPWLE